ncbi:MAG: flagellar hook-associated protein FlgL [Clostridium sp.]|nr:flagellar hook-associated protein FlgL [Clostridium sp.]
MRVTNQMLSQTFLYDLNDNLTNMQSVQQQMSSGQLINKPSDDPLGTSRVMQINTQISQNTQYNSNISDATDWLNVTDTSLGQVNSVLQRVNELLVSTGNPGYGSQQQGAIKDEINQNIGNLSQILNQSYDGKYIFGGNRGTDKPTTTEISTDVKKNTQIYYTDANGNSLKNPDGSPMTVTSNSEISKINSDLTTEVSQGVNVDYNVKATEIMQFTNSSGTAKSLQTILSNITSDLDSGNTTNLTGQDLSDIQDAITNASKLRTRVGALQNRMTSAKDENTTENTNLTDELSKTDDVDYAQATMNYAQAQTVYQASLQASAKIIQPSLMDYLR